MNIKRLHRLYAGTYAVLAFYVLLLIYMLIAIPNGWTLWADKQWADEQIGRAQTLEQMQKITHFAASSIHAGQECCRVLLYIFLFVTFGMIGFLSWSLIMIGRIRREVDHAA